MHRIGIVAALFAACACAESSLVYLDLGPSVRPRCLTQDAAGNLYIAAAILRPGPPASLTTVVTKVDHNLRQVYKFEFAQPGGSIPYAIVVDRQGSVFVAGWTDAAGFPLVNPISGEWHAPGSGFISKLDASGSKLVFSTYFGQTVSALALDAADNLYATGYGTLSDIPAAPIGYRAPNLPAPPAALLFVAKLTNAGDHLIYSAMLGDATPNGIAVAVDGSATVAGFSAEPTYPTTPGVFQRTCGCARAGGAPRLAWNGIVSRISPDGGSLEWSTFLGGTLGMDELHFAGITPDGGVIVAGTATSPDFPITPGAFQTPRANTRPDFVIARLDSAGSRLVYSSRFGSSDYDRITGFQVDPAGRAWLAGSTSRLDFPLLPGTASAGDSLVAALEADGSRLVRTQLLPTGAGVTLLLDTAGNEILFGEAGSLLRFKPEDLSGASLLGVGNAIPQHTRGYTISGAVAPGEIVSLYGTALGPQAGVGAQLDNTGKVATMLGGTQVLFDGFPAPLLYVGANQINAVVPFEVGDRPASMLEVVTSASSSRASVMVIAADPALPAVFDQNFGPYISLVLNQDGSINSLANRAAPGEIVTFWVNGAGRFRQPLATGAIIGPERVAPVLPVTVGVNDLPAEVLYAATAPGMIAGMMQVNARIPREAPPGSYSAMQIHVGDFLVFGSVAVK